MFLLAFVTENTTISPRKERILFGTQIPTVYPVRNLVRLISHTKPAPPQIHYK